MYIGKTFQSLQNILCIPSVTWVCYSFLQNTNTGGPKQWAQLNGKAVEQDGESSDPRVTKSGVFSASSPSPWWNTRFFQFLPDVTWSHRSVKVYRVHSFLCRHQVQGPQTDCSPSLTRNFPHWRQLENRTELARKEAASIRRMGPDQASAPRVSLTSLRLAASKPIKCCYRALRSSHSPQYFFSDVVILVCVYLCKSCQDGVCSSGFLLFIWAICMYLHVSTPR